MGELGTITMGLPSPLPGTLLDNIGKTTALLRCTWWVQAAQQEGD